MKFIIDRIKAYRIKIIYRIFLELYIIITYPVFLVLALILKFLNIKMLNIIYVNAIGHYMLEPECYLRERLHSKQKTYFNIFFLAPRNEVSNLYASHLWKKYFTVIESNIICFLLKPLSRQKLCQEPIAHYAMDADKTAACFSIFSKTYHYDALHTITSDCEKECYEKLSSMGIKKNDWFVTIHVRDSSYRDFKIKKFRDSEIESLFEACKIIKNMGGHVIRMGSDKTEPLNNNTVIYDYPHSKFRSDKMDFFLSSKAKLFIGTNSGLAVVPLVFKTPILYLNMTPMGNSLPLQPNAVSVPKKLFSHDLGRELTFRESLEKPMNNALNYEIFSNANVSFIDNSKEDITNAVIESLQRVDNVFKASEDDIFLQNSFRKLIMQGTYCYGSKGLISNSFLRKNHKLLVD